MKEAINPLIRDRLIKQSSIFSLILLSVSLIAIALGWTHLPPLIPLYNQAPWGDARLAAKQYIFLPPLTALVFLVLNLAFARLVLSTMPLVARFFSMTTAFCCLLVLIFLLRTFQLII